MPFLKKYSYSYPLAWHNIEGTVKAKSLKTAYEKVTKIAKEHLAIFGIYKDTIYLDIKEVK